MIEKTNQKWFVFFYVGEILILNTFNNAQPNFEKFGLFFLEKNSGAPTARPPIS